MLRLVLRGERKQCSYFLDAVYKVTS